jgi:hypothetical protein
MQIDSKLAEQVKAFLDGGDRSFLDTLQAMDRNDQSGQAVVRYLMQIKHWPFTADSVFSDLLTHFFADCGERTKVDPVDYKAATAKMIKDAFDYECIEIVAEPRPEPKPNPGKVTRRPKMISEAEDTKDDSEEGESGSRVFKSINEA